VYSELYNTEIIGCIIREIGETQAAMKSVEDSKSELLIATSELQTKLEVSMSDWLTVTSYRKSTIDVMIVGYGVVIRSRNLQLPPHLDNDAGNYCCRHQSSAGTGWRLNESKSHWFWWYILQNPLHVNYD